MHRLPWLTLALTGIVACGGAATPAAPSNEVQGSAPNHLYAHSYAGSTLGEKISAAITALPDSGGIVDAIDFVGEQRIDQTIQLGTAERPVELRLGTVRLSASVVPFELHPNAKLIGNDKTVITQDDGANLEWLITGTNVTDCEIAHLTVDGNRKGNTAAGSGIGMHTAKRCWLHHLTVQNTVGRFHPGIAFYDGPNGDNTVENNQVRNIGTLIDYADGIYVSGPGNKVRYNRITNATDFGVVCEACSDGLVRGNVIVDVPAGVAVGSGIAGFSAANNVIEDNTISGGNTTTLGVISVYKRNSTPPTSTIVRGNVIRDVVQGHGIMINGAEGVIVETTVLGNIAVTYPSFGILVKDSKDVTITGGSIDSTGSFGIGIGASSNVKVDNLLITDASRMGTGASGIGLDVTQTNSSSITLTRLHIFDTETSRMSKRMLYCIDFGQGGTTNGVVIGDITFNDGATYLGCRIDNVNFNNASQVTIY